MSPQNRIAAVLIAGAVCLLAGVVVREFNDARRMAEYSAQMALLQGAEQLLEKYRTQHGVFPASLDELDFKFPDGGDRSTLDSLQYESNGETYSLIATDDEGNERPPQRGATP